MSNEVIVGIGVICTLLGAILSVTSFKRTLQKDAQAQGEFFGIIKADLGHVKETVDETRETVGSICEKSDNMDKRLVKVETIVEGVVLSVKADRERLDRLEERKNERAYKKAVGTNIG